jgi:hypothetical protein
MSLVNKTATSLLPEVGRNGQTASPYVVNRLSASSCMINMSPPSTLFISTDLPQTTSPLVAWEAKIPDLGALGWLVLLQARMLFTEYTPILPMSASLGMHDVFVTDRPTRIIQV